MGECGSGVGMGEDLLLSRTRASFDDRVPV